MWCSTCVERIFGTMISSRLLQRLSLGTKLSDDFYLVNRKVGQMHWSKRGLHWKIMLKPSSNLWVKSLSFTNSSKSFVCRRLNVVCSCCQKVKTNGSPIEKTRPRGYKTWVRSQTQNKAQWLAACGHVSASSQSLRFILSLRMSSSFITSRTGLEVIKLEYSLRLERKGNDRLLADTCQQADIHFALFLLYGCVPR